MRVGRTRNDRALKFGGAATGGDAGDALLRMSLADRRQAKKIGVRSGEKA
jgi:hypothetical protein